MSRQFQCFLLPTDIDALIAKLKREVGLTLIDWRSNGPTPMVIGSPTRADPLLAERRTSVSANCYLIRDGAEVKLNYIAQQGYWLVHEERSEVIQFIGFEFDGEVLISGRFFFQKDFLLDAAIWPKAEGFLSWADRIFRCAKRYLTYSKSLNAYIGEDARCWKEQGGQFAWMRVNGRLLIAEDNHAPN